MVLVTVKINNETKTMYMDEELYNQSINHVKPSVEIEDLDFVEIVDGEEGSGKSVLAQQLAIVRDPNFTIENICFTPDEFTKAVTNAKKYSCIIFDEAFTGLSSRASLSEINNLIVSLMMEMRQKNLFIIIVMPTFFMLDRYVVLHRAKGLFHVYMNGKTRGFWRFYNRKSLKYLYLTGKKYYDYSYASHTSFGRFSKFYAVDEQEYRKRKWVHFAKKKRKTKSETYKEQRDVILYAFMKEISKSARSMSILLEKYDIKLSHQTVSEIFHSIHSQFSDSGES